MTGVRARSWTGWVVAVLMAVVVPEGTKADEGAWAALRQGGHVAIMRHALAPGVGDPPNLDLSDCRTQRNLNEEGRAQARRAGDEFRRRGIRAARVLSSRWCRARETAELLGLGPVEHLPALDSFFGDRTTAPEQTRSLRAFLAGLPDQPPVVLVTHQVNITDLTGLYPNSAEMFVLHARDPNAARVVGMVQF